MQAFLRLLYAATVSMILVSAAAAETLVLRVTDANVEKDQRTGSPVVTIRLSANFSACVRRVHNCKGRQQGRVAC